MRPRLVLLLLGLALGATGITGAIWLARQLRDAETDWQRTALIKWGGPPQPTPQLVAEWAKNDLVAFSWGAWDSPQMQQAATDMRRANLDIHLGTYFSAHAVPRWCIADYQAGNDCWGSRWAAALLPYLARTTAGDTASIYTNQPMYNVLDPGARSAAIGLLGEYVRRCGLTWVMIDFISVPMPNLKGPEWERFELGDLDLDGDGIGHWDDPDEQSALRYAWYEFASEMRRRLPQGTLLIPNGELALVDVNFAHLVDGAYVEGFGKWFYGTGEVPNYGNALDPAYGPQAVPNLCNAGRWAREPGIVLLEDYNDRGDIGLLAAMWPGAVELRRSRDDVTMPPSPDDLSWLGAPQHQAVRVGDGWSREYSGGMITARGVGPSLAFTHPDRK